MAVSNINIPGITKTEQVALNDEDVKACIDRLAEDDNPRNRHDCHGAMHRAGFTDRKRREQLITAWIQRKKRMEAME